MSDELKATITDPKGFRCAPEGHTVVTFPHGAEVVGQVARWAVDMGAASWRPAIDTKIIAPTETKRRGKRKSPAERL